MKKIFNVLTFVFCLFFLVEFFFKIPVNPYVLLISMPIMLAVSFLSFDYFCNKIDTKIKARFLSWCSSLIKDAQDRKSVEKDLSRIIKSSPTIKNIVKKQALDVYFRPIMPSLVNFTVAYFCSSVVFRKLLPNISSLPYLLTTLMITAFFFYLVTLFYTRTLAYIYLDLDLKDIELKSVNYILANNDFLIKTLDLNGKEYITKNNKIIKITDYVSHISVKNDSNKEVTPKPI